MEYQTFICSCNSFEHQCHFWVDDETKEVYMYVKLNSERNFFKRLWVGIKYICGYKSRFGEFDEMVFEPDDLVKLEKLINESR